MHTAGGSFNGADGLPGSGFGDAIDVGGGQDGGLGGVGQNGHNAYFPNFAPANPPSQDGLDGIIEVRW